MPIVAEPLVPVRFRYLDVNTNFGERSPKLLVAEIEAVNNQLFNLFQTFVGEADYEPEFGSTIPSRLFDMLPGTAHLLETDIYVAINRWMGQRIQVNIGDIKARENYVKRAYEVTFRYVYPAMGVSVDYGARLYVSNSAVREQ